MLLVWAPLASLSLAGQEHRRTIPLADSDRMTEQTDHVPTRREHSDPSQGM